MILNGEEKFMIVLKAMLMGFEVNLHDNYRYILMDDTNDNKAICLIGKKPNDENSIDNVALFDNISLNNFIKLCNELPDEYIKTLDLNMTLLLLKGLGSISGSVD